MNWRLSTLIIHTMQHVTDVFTPTSPHSMNGAKPTARVRDDTESAP